MREGGGGGGRWGWRCGLDWSLLLGLVKFGGRRGSNLGWSWSAETADGDGDGECESPTSTPRWAQETLLRNWGPPVSEKPCFDFSCAEQQPVLDYAKSNNSWTKISLHCPGHVGLESRVDPNSRR